MSVVRVSVPKNCPWPIKKESVNGTGLSIEYRMDFCIETDGTCPRVNQIMDEAQNFTGGNYIVPNLGDTYFFNNETDLDAVVTSVGPLRKSDSEGKYVLPVVWTNINEQGGSPGDPPENLYATVDIEFQETEVPGEEWLYVGMCDQLGRPYGNSFGGLLGPAFYPALDTPFLSPGQIGPARNSAGCEKLKNKLEYRHLLRVVAYANTWNCGFDEVLGACNSEPVKMIEFDDTNVTYCCTYPPLSLTILDIGKNVVDFFGQSIVCVEFLIEYDASGIGCKLLDSGTQAAFFPGVADTALGGEPLQADDDRFLHNKTGKRDVGSRGEILLNGEGAEWCWQNEAGTSGQPIYLAYLDAEQDCFDFSTLPVSLFVPGGP